MTKLIRHWTSIPLLASGIAFSGTLQLLPAQSPDGEVQLRATRFWRGEARTLLEGVIGLPVASATRTVELTVRDSTGRTLHTERWTDSADTNAAALAGMQAQTATKFELLLDPGLYTIVARRSALGAADSAAVQVRGFAATPVASDLVLSAAMRVLGANEEPSAAEMKRGRYAIERGARVTVLPHDPKLWYYVELYRQGADSVAQLDFRVLRAGADSALVRVTRQVAVAERGTVDAAALVVAGLPPGDYRLQLIARSGGREETREARFSMASFASAPIAAAPRGVTVAEATLMERYFAADSRSDAEVGALIEALTMSAPGEPVPTASVTGLSPDAQRRFLARYWSRLPDTDPSTAQHELLEEYIERVRYIERHFSEQRGRSAVRTDRGRIYLKYGPADMRQQVQMGNNRALDVWKYTRMRNIKFAFLDETGFQNYNLIYAKGDPSEQSLADWADRVGRNEREAINVILNF